MLSPFFPRRATRAGVGVLTVAALLSGGAAYGMQPGVDTSHYQHATSLNWSKVAATGVKFAFLKATEATTFQDPYFKADWAATANAGIFRGAYHFARPSVGSAVPQAKYFAGVIGPQKGRGTLPPVLDLEATGGLSPKQLITWTHNWLAEVQTLTGRTPMIYVSPAFWEERLNNSTAFHAYPLWIANYGVSTPRVPGGWPTFSFWQSTSSGKVAGISGNVDKDWFNGSLIQLEKFALAYTRQATTLSLAVDNAAPQTGQTVHFTGTLTNPGMAAIANRTVTVSTTTPGGSTWTSLGTATTSSTGAYSFAEAITAPGDYKATFAGDSDYKATSSSVVSVTLTPVPTTVTLVPASTTTLAGTAVSMNGVLKAGKTLLSGRKVTIAEQAAGAGSWTTLATATTDANGAFKASPTLVHTGTLRATYAGELAYATAVSATKTMTVDLNPTTVSLAASRLAPHANQRVTMSGALVDGSKPVAARVVAIQRQRAGGTTWSTVTTRKTDATGHWTATVRVPAAGTYRALFAGDAIYATSRSAGKALTITPPDASTLTMTDRLGDTGILKRGHSATLSGRLTGSHGGAIGGRTIYLWKRLVGTSKWYVVARTVTADTGAWHLSVQPTHSAVFKAVFHGGAWHAAATSPRLRVRVR